MRTTVAIPLHRAARWAHVVEQNIASLRSAAHIVVSDPFESDATLSELREKFDHVPEVSFLGRRDIDPGWVAHCNDLQSRSSTEFFMWLPQDDSIDQTWIHAGEEALTSDSEAVAACGTLQWIVAENSEGGDFANFAKIPMLDDWCAPDQVTRLTTALAVAGSRNASSLGLLFRSLQRSSASVPLPPGRDGAWSDVLWAISVLSRGPVAATSATYQKRGHAHATHATWPELPQIRDVRAAYLARAAFDADPATRATAFAAAWDRDYATRAERERELIDLVERMKSELASTQNRVAEMERSRSWRLTAPFRAASSRLRGRAPQSHVGRSTFTHG